MYTYIVKIFKPNNDQDGNPMPGGSLVYHGEAVANSESHAAEHVRQKAGWKISLDENYLYEVTRITEVHNVFTLDKEAD